MKSGSGGNYSHWERALLIASLVAGAGVVRQVFVLAIVCASGEPALPVPLHPSGANGFPGTTLHGTVRIESKIQPRSAAINLYSRRGGPPVPPRVFAPTNELENVVVYMERNSKALEVKTKSDPDTLPEPSIRQVNETFVPHVLAIQVGTTVNFPNEDPFFHNVFSLSGAKNFDLGRYPMNQARSVHFNRPGIVKVFCHIHSHMNAVIMVFDHPYFCVPDGEGKYSIKNLLPGEYTMVAWHERLKPQKRTVRVQPGTNVPIDLVL